MEDSNKNWVLASPMFLNSLARNRVYKFRAKLFLNLRDTPCDKWKPLDILRHSGTPCNTLRLYGNHALLDLASSVSVNITLSPSAVEVGQSITLTVDFTYYSAIYVQSLSCGCGTYGTGSGTNNLVSWNRFQERFVLASAAFPAEYNGRVTTSGKIITISNVPFGEEGRKFDSLPWFGANSMTSTSQIIEGQNATLKCNVTSRPASSITWSYDNSIITATQSNSSITNGDYQDATSILTIVNVSQAMHGKSISCTAKPVYGDAIHKTTSLTVVYKPENVVLTASSYKPLNGASVTLNCASDSVPAATYKFFRVQGAIETELANAGGSGVLTINAINYKDLGSYNATYKCIASNMLGSVSAASSAFLDIQVPPELNVSENRTVTEGENASFKCTVIAANPTATITWLDASNQELSHSNGNLSFTNVTRHQAGQYRCKADNNVTGSPVFQTATLTVNFAPMNVMLTTGSNMTVVNGSSLSITCSSQAVPGAEYDFYVVIGGVSSVVSSLNSRSTGVLQIESITTDLSTYKTMYKCMPRNSIGNGTMKQLEFNVHGMPSTIRALSHLNDFNRCIGCDYNDNDDGYEFLSVPPNDITISPDVKTLVVNESQSVTLSCSVRYGNPSPTIKWTSLVVSDVFIGNAIVFNSVNRTNAKTYTCSASNAVKTTTKSIALTVQYGPERVSPSVFAVFKCETQSHELSCIANGVPIPDAYILFANGSRTPTYPGNASIRISSLAAGDFAMYRCIFRSVVGRLDIGQALSKTILPGPVRNLAIKSENGEFEMPLFARAVLALKNISFNIRRRERHYGQIRAVFCKALFCKAVSCKAVSSETDVIRNVNTHIEPAHNYTDLKTINEEVRPYQTLNTVSNVNNQNQSHYMEVTEKTRVENQPYASLSLYE
eukprot:gene11272-12452_t